MIDHRLKNPLTALAALLLVGTAGYALLEGWPVLDSLYMTVITLSTVGFGELRPLSAGDELRRLAEMA